MTTPKVCDNGTMRDANDDDLAVLEAHRRDAFARAAAADAKAAALASARTKLAALGLTDAEVVALLGG
jgi:hypothetical protein